MWQWFVETLRIYPEIAIFLTLGLGFWLGKLKIGSFSLGVVTCTLLAGVLVGQLEISISGNVKSTFFLMFLFAVGYGVGPQFFQGLKGDGIQQALFSVVQCVAVLVTAVVVGKFLGYDAGATAGLLSGSSTISAVLGVATDSINQLGITAAEKKAMLDGMPVAYAVTYLFGTAGSAWILASLGPKILRVDIVAECRKYEEEMGGALERLGEADLVLVDTAGRSPRSDSRIEQLHGMLLAARPDETHLVLSATSSREATQSILDGFSAVRPTAAILTKLDETPQLAGMLGALEGRALPLSYVTTGQQVPDDIEVADAETLVRNLLATHILTIPMGLSGCRHVA